MMSMQATALQRDAARADTALQRPWAAMELGVGVVSRTAVDAVLEIAYQRRTPMMLIASRRQIDGEILGGGYVEDWSTEQLAEYVRARDPLGSVILCRDHGGPRQGHRESSASVTEASALERAKASFLADIEAGFELLHVDVSAAINDRSRLDDAIRLTVELSHYCYAEALKRSRSIEFEIGLEEQVTSVADAGEFESTTELTLNAFADSGLPKPRFVVAQTGTKVEEMRNVGELNGTPLELDTVMKLNALAKTAHRLGIQIKAHNSDYLADSRLAILRGAGILTLNVAPEFAVAETKAMLELLATTQLKKCQDDFIELAVNSNQWRKWMSQDTKASEMDRALIAGHYVFRLPEVQECRRTLFAACRRLGIDGQLYMRTAVKRCIMRYLTF